jgi:hypothetical protein
MANPIERIRRPVPSRLLPRTVEPARALARRLAGVTAWARLTNGVLRLGTADVTSWLGRENRRLAWQALTETISTIAALAAKDLPPHSGLAALVALADRLRERVSTEAPQPATQINAATEPLQFFVLEMLVHDVQPCLSRWQSRLESWVMTGRRVNDWPLLPVCRNDLARTRERLIERSWQLGLALRLSSLGRLLPQRPVSVPTLAAVEEIDTAEATAVTSLDMASMEAGWRIYVEAATRLPPPALPSAPGALGEAIAALDTLADEIRAALRSMPPLTCAGSAGTIQALALRLLIEGLQPFLLEWRARYRNFSASDRSEAKWRRGGDLRAALIETRARCQRIVDLIGRQIGAPPLPDTTIGIAATEESPPRQLPPPMPT